MDRTPCDRAGGDTGNGERGVEKTHSQAGLRWSLAFRPVACTNASRPDGQGVQMTVTLTADYEGFSHPMSADERSQ